MPHRLPLVLCAASGAASPVLAGVPPAETVRPAFDQAIPNLRGRALRVVVVEYPPGAASRPHRHAPSAFVYAYVLSGAVRSQVDDAPVRIYRAGDGWSEPPGAHHAVSENASGTEPARLLAVFVVAEDEVRLTIPDTRQERSR